VEISQKCQKLSGIFSENMQNLEKKNKIDFQSENDVK